MARPGLGHRASGTGSSSSSGSGMCEWIYIIDKISLKLFAMSNWIGPNLNFWEFIKWHTTAVPCTLYIYCAQCIVCNICNVTIITCIKEYRELVPNCIMCWWTFWSSVLGHETRVRPNIWITHWCQFRIHTQWANAIEKLWWIYFWSNRHVTDNVHAA